MPSRATTWPGRAGNWLPRLILSFQAAALIFAQEAPAQPETPAEKISFSRDIAPIFVAKCLNCHGADKPKGSYQLHTFDLARKAGDSELLPIVPDQPQESELFKRLIAEDKADRMPQKDDPLPLEQIALIERWIRQGALFDGDPSTHLTLLIPSGPHPMPPGAYPRPVPVAALAFSPDGRELAAGGYHEITIWNPENGVLLRRITNVTQRIQSLAASPAKPWLAVAGGLPGRRGEAALFDRETGSRLRVLGTDPDFFLSICFSPDYSRVAAGGAGNTIYIYDSATGDSALKIQQHADWVTDLAFSPDGSKIASASRDRSARIYDSQNGELLLNYYEHGAFVNAVAFSSDGQFLCSGGRDKKVHLWSAIDGRKTGEITGFPEEILRLRVAKDRLFSACADQVVREHSLPDRKLVRTYSGLEDWVLALAYDEASQSLAASSHNGQVRVWNWSDGSLRASFTAAPGWIAAKSAE